MHNLHYIVVEGGVDEVTELLKASWGKVCLYWVGTSRKGDVACGYRRSIFVARH